MLNARIAARQLGLKIATNITLSGGRSGQLVESLVGPPNSVIKGNGWVFLHERPKDRLFGTSPMTVQRP
jgi:hypothetical protein